MSNWSKEGAICAYCHHVNLPSGDNWGLYSDDLEEFNCGSCGKEFKVEVFTSYSWVTERLDDDEDAA